MQRGALTDTSLDKQEQDMRERREATYHSQGAYAETANCSASNPGAIALGRGLNDGTNTKYNDDHSQSPFSRDIITQTEHKKHPMKAPSGVSLNASHGIIPWPTPWVISSPPGVRSID